jgi:hypothetical protein
VEYLTARNFQFFRPLAVQVVITQVGRLEDTPEEEVRRILVGLGGRRRGLARPPSGRSTTTTTSTQPAPIADFNYDDYYYDAEQA